MGLGWPNITAYDNYQLNIEDALEVAEHDVVWFVDAAKAGPSPYHVRDLSAASSIEFTSHIVSPEAILAIARQLHYGKTPQAFLLAIRGYQFEFVEELTTGAADNLRVALTMLTDKIRASHAPVAAMNIGLGNRRRIPIFLIRPDAHARATLRKALEAADFSVGEAANNREGERTALRIKPDAILAELMTEPAEAGMTISERLKASGGTIPCYIVSTASDALMGSVGLHEIGISGVFLKPVEPAIVIQTLKTRLGVHQGDAGRA